MRPERRRGDDGRHGDGVDRLGAQTVQGRSQAFDAGRQQVVEDHRDHPHAHAEDQRAQRVGQGGPAGRGLAGLAHQAVGGQQRAEQADERGQGRDPPQRAHVAPELLRLPAMRAPHGALAVHGRPSPAPDGGRGHARGGAGVHLAVVERLAAVELPLVEPVQEPGEEVVRNDGASSQAEQPLQ
ncbi:hypothetical protein HK102_012047, partial [Quaeritorhiza haematococci]